MSNPLTIFDRFAVRRHRDRSAQAGGDDFLHREIAVRLAERLDEIKRRFPVALDLGCRAGLLGEAIAGRGGIESLARSDLSTRFAARAANAIVADEEALPFAAGAFDLVLSNLALHWVNDLPGALIQIRRSLKPDGLFLASLLGGDTLHELRWALMEAEIAETGGASPRISPFAGVRDIGSLSQRAGFALPMVDADTITVTYADAFALMRDLRAMGETNAIVERRRNATRRGVFARAAALYQQKFGDAAGRIPATFQAIFVTAWAPAASQPKPLAPGSAKTSLAAALDTVEHKTGDKSLP